MPQVKRNSINFAVSFAMGIYLGYRNGVVIMSILFARQEIYDQSKKVAAYELLYRGMQTNASFINPADEEAGDVATSTVITNLFTNTFTDNLLNGIPAFINFTRNHILDDVPFMLPKEKIVIEVLENVFVDEVLVDKLYSFHKQGYRIALDDFSYEPNLDPLIEIADIIKIDLMMMSQEEIENELRRLGQYKGQFLAEKIETKQELEWCLEHDFKYFQGYYFSRPNCVEGEPMSENKAAMLNLMTELHDPDVALEKIESILMQIPKLSYRILRLANSATYYTGHTIDTLLTAINKLGLQKIRDWISLLLISSFDDVSAAQIERTLIRAKMCQVLAQQKYRSKTSQAYTVGMLSNLDNLFNQPLESLLKQIPLMQNLTDALLQHKGDLGYLLTLVMQYEQACFEQMDFSVFSEQALLTAYTDGLRYADEVMQIIGN